MSLPEELFERSLKSVYTGIFIRNHRPDWLRNHITGRNLELDFYLPEDRIAFEIQGEHHYLRSEQKKRDLQKIHLCEKAGVKLALIGILFLHPIRISKKLKALGSKGLVPPSPDSTLLSDIHTYRQKYTNSSSKCIKSPQFWAQPPPLDRSFAYAVTYWEPGFGLKKGYIARLLETVVILVEQSPGYTSYKEKSVPLSRVRNWHYGKQKAQRKHVSKDGVLVTQRNNVILKKNSAKIQEIISLRKN